MSKRHHNEITTSLQPIFYAPLTEGDLTDHVSGSVLSVTDNAVVSWDSDKEMYLFNSMSVTTGYGTEIKWQGLNLGLYTSESTAGNIEYSITFDMCLFSVLSSSRFIPGFYIVDANRNYIYINLISARQWEPTLNVDYHIVITCKDGLFNIYANGTNVYSANSTISPSGKTPTDCNSVLTIICTYWGYFNQTCSVYLKDIKVYNKSIID